MGLQAKWLVEMRGTKGKTPTTPAKIITPSKVPPPPADIPRGQGKALALLQPKSTATTVGEKRKETTTIDDDVFQATPPTKKGKVTQRKITKKPGKPLYILPHFVKGLGFVSAQEGSQRLQASQQQEAVKLAKAKVDKTKGKGQAKAKRANERADKLWKLRTSRSQLLLKNPSKRLKKRKRPFKRAEPSPRSYRPFLK
jgi:hypothetical protein